MKKWISLMLALAMLLCLTACGESGEQNTAQTQGETAGTTEAVENAQREEGFVFTYNGLEIPMDVPAGDILAALGEPKSYSEQASCAFEGLDKTYYFGSFYLQTYPAGEEDYVYCVWLVDDSVTTAEGIYIGATQQEVEDAYGAENYNGTNAYIVTKGNSTLTVILSGGTVSSIQYDAVVS